MSKKLKTNRSVEIERGENRERISEIDNQLKNKLTSDEIQIVNRLIEYDGEKMLKRWKIIRNLSFIFSLLFLIFLYLIFRHLTTDFKIIEDSFTNIFCPV